MGSTDTDHEPTQYLDGEWWFPDAPERRVCGRLVLDPPRALRLELMGALRDKLGQAEVQPEVIHGFALGAKHITLWHSVLASSGGSESPWPTPERVQRQVYEPQVCLEGGHFGGPDATIAESLTFQWTQSEKWARLYDHPENVTRFATGGLHEQLAAAAARQNPEPIDVVVKQMRVRLERESTFTERWPHQVELSRRVQINLKPIEPARLADLYWTQMRDVLDFLSFIMGMPICATRAWAVIATTATAEVPPVTAQILSPGPRGATGCDDEDNSHILITYHGVESRFQTALRRWLEMNTACRIACLSFLGVRYKPGFLEGAYMATARAVEGFSRLEHGGKKPVEDSQFARLEADLRRAVRSALDRDAAEVVEHRIGSSLNQPTLSAQYSSVLRHTLPLMKMGAEHADDWAQELAWVRNSLAHGLPRLIVNSSNVNRLFALLGLLSAAFEALVMDALGLPSECIADALREGGRLMVIAGIDKGTRIDRQRQE